VGIIWEYHAHLGGSLGGGGTAPFFVCDTCGKKFDNGMGKIIWEQHPGPFEEGQNVSTGRYWILGKGGGHEACDTVEHQGHPWNDLDEFLVNITHNAKLDLNKAKADADDRREQFGI
jgi:hypothetical protein